MKRQRVGILSYGTALPRQCVLTEEIAQQQGKENLGEVLGVRQKSVPAADEDTITLATAAALQAIQRFPSIREELSCLFVGSESHPYAVKPSGTVVAQALGLPKTLSMADLQFACKAGTQSLQVALAYVRAEMISAGLAIGADTAQARPGDVLEFTAGAGAAAFVVGSGARVIAELVDTVSYASDTPDFWRRPGQSYPEHAGRFTAEPGYFAHVTAATRLLLERTSWQPSQIDRVVFHTPNGRFPREVAKKLGFTEKQLAAALVVGEIGNTYAAASMLALAATLDVAKAGETILLCSYGSGAGADAFAWRTTAALPRQRKTWNGLVRDQIAKLQTISYAEATRRKGQA